MFNPKLGDPIGQFYESNRVVRGGWIAEPKNNDVETAEYMMSLSRNSNVGGEVRLCWGEEIKRGVKR